jgi:hypothetical protein
VAEALTPQLEGGGLRRRAAAAKRLAATRLALGLLAVAATGLLVQAGSPLLRSVGLAPVSQRYVALWFASPAQLPKSPGARGRLEFRFVVGDYTGSAIKQPWVVSALDKRGRSRLVLRGWAYVANGRAATVPVSMVVPPRDKVAQIEVSLPGRRLSPIEFHLEAASGTGGAKP